MAKKKIVTTEEIEANEIPAGGEPAAPENEIDPNLSELMDYLDGISTSANLVKIYKIQDGRKAYCGQTEPGALNEDAILNKWGGGSYYLLAFYNGRFVAGGSRRIDLFQAPMDALKPPGVQPSSNGENNGFALLQEQINRQHEMMLRMIESSKNNSIGMPEIVSMMRDMQAMAPKPPDIGGMLGPVLDLFGKTMDLAKEQAGGGNGDSWQGIAMKALEKLPLIIGQLTPAAGPRAPIQPGAAGAPEIANEADMQKFIVKSGLNWLKAKAKLGKPVEAISDMLIQNIDDETFGPVAMFLLNQPFETLGQYDPEILQEPLQTWFKRLYDDLKEAVKDESSEPITGPSGGDTDPQ